MTGVIPWRGARSVHLGKIVLIFLVATNNFRNCVDSLKERQNKSNESFLDRLLDYKGTYFSKNIRGNACSHKNAT